MAVDQPRHQHPPAKIDDLGPRRLDGALGHLGKNAVPDQDLVPRLEDALGGIEQIQVLQQNFAHCFLPLGAFAAFNAAGCPCTIGQ